MKPAKDRSGKPAENQHRMLLGVIVLLILTILVMLIRPPLPAPPAPPRLEMHKAPKSEPTKTAEGTAISYHYNTHLDINSMEIKSSESGIISADFRPHTAKKVMDMAKVGDQVRVQYTLNPTDEIAGYQLNEITNKRTGRHLVLSALPPPADIPQHTMENFTLDNPELITDPYGGIAAMRKHNLLFHFKPGLVDDIMPLIKANKHFKLMAVRREDELGFVNINHDKVYIVLNITIDNQTFLVR